MTITVRMMIMVMNNKDDDDGNNDGTDDIEFKGLLNLCEALPHYFSTHTLNKIVVKVLINMEMMIVVILFGVMLIHSLPDKKLG